MLVKSSLFRGIPAQVVIWVEQRDRIWMRRMIDVSLLSQIFLIFFRFFVHYSAPSVVPSKFAR
jgi:hypothetical protein